MTNTILTTSVILDYTLANFVNEMPFIHTASRNAEREMMRGPYKYGDTINIRRAPRSVIQDGQSLAYQNYQEKSEPLTIAYWPGRLISFNSFELTLQLDDFYERVMSAHVTSIANQIERFIASNASLQLYNYEGSSSSAINSFAAIDLLNARLNLMGLPMSRDRYLVLSQNDSHQVKTSLVNYYNKTFNEGIGLHSALGNLANFDVFQSQNVFVQNAGNFGAGPITTTAIVSSGNTIPMTGFPINTVVFNAGDRFSVSDVFTVNPVGFNATPRNMQFVVTENITSDGAGNANVLVAPEIISDTGNSFKNVSNPIPSGATVTPLGSHNVNVAYERGALDIVMPPLDKLIVAQSSVVTDNKLGISLRLSMQGDVQNSVNAYRLDALVGIKWHPEYAVVGASAPQLTI